MEADSGGGWSGDMPTGVCDRAMTEAGSHDTPTLFWPWSYRVAGAWSSFPAVEVYEAGSLLDVVSSTRLAAQVLRGARFVRAGGRRRVLAWGRLPLTMGVPTVVFSRGWLRGSGRAVNPVSVTNWCWLAVADGRYDTVAVLAGGSTVRRRLQASRS